MKEQVGKQDALQEEYIKLNHQLKKAKLEQSNYINTIL